MPCSAAWRKRTPAAKRALLATFGLTGFERAWPGQLSGGMRQRLALLRTFLTPRETLLLDEPFGALDAITRRQMQEWLQSVWMADRRTALLVTHDVDEALLLSDRVFVMSARPGTIVECLDVATASARDPRHHHVRVHRAQGARARCPRPRERRMSRTHGDIQAALQAVAPVVRAAAPRRRAPFPDATLI